MDPDYDFFCITDFKIHFKNHRSYYKHYGNIERDIYEFLNDKTADELFEQQAHIFSKLPDFRIIKARIQNSTMNTSDSGGYRLLYLMNKKHNHLVLLIVFAKTGTLAKNTLNDTETKKLTKAYSEQFKKKELLRILFNHESKLIEVQMPQS